MDVLVFLGFLAVVGLISFLVVRAQWRKRPKRLGPGSGTAYGSAGYLAFDSRERGGDSGGSYGGCGSGGD